IRFLAAGVATRDGLHAGKQLVRGLSAPEATTAEDERFGFGIRRRISLGGASSHGERDKRKNAKRQSEAMHEKWESRIVVLFPISFTGGNRGNGEQKKTRWFPN